MASSLLSHHLEQISSTSSAISILTFLGPKPFTNAMLARRDLSDLLRETLPHENALFSLSMPNPQPSSSTIPSSKKSTNILTAALGPSLARKIHPAPSSNVQSSSREHRELDVDLLLNATSKLCTVYPIPEAEIEIQRLRNRWEGLRDSITNLEKRVARNERDLAQLAKSRDTREQEVEYGEDEYEYLRRERSSVGEKNIMFGGENSQEEKERHDLEIEALKSRRTGLVNSVSEIEKDLGGLMR